MEFLRQIMARVVSGPDKAEAFEVLVMAFTLADERTANMFANSCDLAGKEGDILHHLCIRYGRYREMGR